MCLHSRMGNNNWLKQSLLWENKRSGRVASEGQAWWHSEHLNSHWLLGSGGCRAPPGAVVTGTDLRGCRGRDEADSRSHLPPRALQGRLFLLRCRGISDCCAPCANGTKAERKTPFCARPSVPPPWSHCTTALTNVTGAAVHAGDPCPPLSYLGELQHCGQALVGILCWTGKWHWSSDLFTCLLAFSRFIFSLPLDFFIPEIFFFLK